MRFKKKNLEIEFRVTKENYIYADLSILNEILRNLFANAIKFSFPNGKINIEFHESDTTTYLSFVDFGKGILEYRIQNLFTESMSSPGTLGEKGFGIGLKLCFELMRLHQGNIQVESKPNEGSRFILEFPKP
ncbi:sensor histidine kinase [Leptospira kemamanensis]|uniref:sensor histidine kinase n=1 Tax=Leptospira kemamanensis TaxID=2484942 RepID=UPI001FCA2D44|nr:HAMP domain-containing sensor histidine kinase [Leptospira kemamanensis]